MKLELKDVEKQVGADTHLYRQSLTLADGAVNVLLGATQAGKTSLMRIMAGLDVPTRGQVVVDGQDLTGVPVRQRDVAMVYQQFINYPAMTVFDNIASPLRLRGQSDVQARVQALAERLHIEMFLQRLPQELSGGQQQRVALARALAKDASLMLFDEPLVNLDYKLREELREELTALFSTGQSTVVYATTEPAEALMLGGFTAVMDAGELLQHGPTAEVFHRPASLRVARAFSDPPMNLLSAQRQGEALVLRDGTALMLGDLPETPRELVLGCRAHSVRLQARPGDVALSGRLELAEISGSDTFFHIHTGAGDVVAQLSGVHEAELAAPIQVHLAADQLYVFDAQGPLLSAPARAPRGH